MFSCSNSLFNPNSKFQCLVKVFIYLNEFFFLSNAAVHLTDLILTLLQMNVLSYWSDAWQSNIWCGMCQASASKWMRTHNLQHKLRQPCDRVGLSLQHEKLHGHSFWPEGRETQPILKGESITKGLQTNSPALTNITLLFKVMTL